MEWTNLLRSPIGLGAMSVNPESFVPTSTNMCGEFVEPATPDAGRSFPAAIQPTCAAPEVTVDGTAEVIFVDGEPQFAEELS